MLTTQLSGLHKTDRAVVVAVCTVVVTEAAVRILAVMVATSVEVEAGGVCKDLEYDA